MRLMKQIIQKPEDFIVEEVPLYEPSGVGTHTLFAIRKRNISTLDAIRQISRVWQVSPSSFGYAGLKDKYAVTTQVLSVEAIPPERVLNIELPGIDVLWAVRHPHKLRVGHLRGNRFEITLRDVSLMALPTIEAKMRKLATQGVPNRYGAQRFGNRHNTHLIGKALIKGNWDKAIDYILEDTSTQIRERLRTERERHSPEKTIMTIPHRLRKLYLSAYQAYLYNCILERRSPNLAKLLDGDIAIKHANGAPFLVENTTIEQPRADAFEISPSGPIFGYKMRQPTGQMQALESELLAEEMVEPTAFRKVAGIQLPGTRRSLRMQMEVHHVKSIDDGLQLSFTLPAGGYATVVLDELRDCFI